VRDRHWNQTKPAKIPVSTLSPPDTLPSICVREPQVQEKRSRGHSDTGHPCLGALFFSTSPLRLPMWPSHPNNSHIVTIPTSPPPLDTARLVLVKHTLRLLEDCWMARMHHLPTF